LEYRYFSTKGNIAFDSNSNSSTVYSLFQLNSVTCIAGYRKLNVTYLSGTAPVNAEAV
jgi:hypothetical protein